VRDLKVAADRSSEGIGRIRPGPLSIASGAQLMADGQHGASGVRYDPVSRRDRQVRCRAGHAFFRSDAQNDQIGFSSVGEFCR
jgi:hypothetical protein